MLQSNYSIYLEDTMTERFIIAKFCISYKLKTTVIDNITIKHSFN